MHHARGLAGNGCLIDARSGVVDFRIRRAQNDAKSGCIEASGVYPTPYTPHPTPYAFKYNFAESESPSSRTRAASDPKP